MQEKTITLSPEKVGGKKTPESQKETKQPEYKKFENAFPSSEAIEKKAEEISGRIQQIVKLEKATEKGSLSPKDTAEILEEKKKAAVKDSAEFYQIPESMVKNLGDRTVLIKPLGAGGQGDVYESFDTHLMLENATKFLTKPTDELQTKRLQREAKLMASLPGSDFLPRIYDAGVTEDGAWYTMQRIQGKNLAERAREKNGLSFAEKIQALRDISQGLYELQQHKIIHRDLKPSNVVYDEENGHYKLIDFGLSKREGDVYLKSELPLESADANLDDWLTLLGQQEFSSSAETQAVPKPGKAKLSEKKTGVLKPKKESLTEEGAIMGTPQYMSPEQARGLALSGKTDIWSLGVMAYELFGEKEPFEGNNVVAMIISVLNHHPMDLKDVNSSLPKELTDLVMKMIDKDPQKRPDILTVIKTLSKLKGEKNTSSSLQQDSSKTSETHIGVPSARQETVTSMALEEDLDPARADTRTMEIPKMELDSAAQNTAEVKKKKPGFFSRLFRKNRAG